MLKRTLRFILPTGVAAAAILSVAAATPANVAPVASVSLSDNFGFAWSLAIDDTTAEGWFLGGAVTTSIDTRNANGTLLLSNNAITMGGDEGLGVPFWYSVKFSSGTGKGIWINQTGPFAGHGTVTVTVTGPNPPPPPAGPKHGAVPGTTEVE